ncbi:MAG: MBL fold metallo-hydrolase [Moraxellaceae bacterium]|nr:MBL fold metallo-hydrolase [Moraxellaceae bacterium]
MMPTSSFSSSPARALRRASAALLLGLGLLSSALAAPPQVRDQVPGFYRQALGDFEVTALYDGYVDLAPGLLKGISAERLQSALARMFIANSKGVQTAVNAYLVHTGERLVLVDAGSAKCFGPTMGNVVANIQAAGYKPEDVDAVLLTHLHPDHLCGVLTADGKPAFPRATLWATQADADFWLSESAAQAAPPDFRPFFDMARNAVAPYRAAGSFRSYKPGEPLFAGVTVVDTAGHTPGHSSYLFSSKGQEMLVWGDIVHSHAVQFAQPDISIEFDSDQKKAIAARRNVFARAAKNGWWIGGAHLPFPGIGHVRAEGKSYAWVPVEFGPIRTDR